MYKTRTSCRACGLGDPQLPTLKRSTAAGAIYQDDSKLIPVFSLGVQPLANDFVAGSDDHAGFAPLEVLFCPRCKLGQLSVEVAPNILYAHNYAYVTSTSHTMRNHFATINQDLISQCKNPRTIVEIGSNDGLLLEYFLGNGWQVGLGIDPAQNLCMTAQSKGIHSLCGYFNEATAKTALKSVGHPDLILARHCFCHVNDWKGFVKGLEALAGDDTVIAIEVPWAQDMLEKLEFDTVYHEHTSYLSLESIEYLFADSTFGLFDARHYDIHGGAVMLIFKKRPFDYSAKLAALQNERISLDMWRKFSAESEVKIMELSAMVRSFASAGKKVVGYGASAKSTVWINACQFTRQHIKFIADSTKGKWYKLSPGTDIPIVDEGALTRDLPDYAICFAWNFFKEIYEKETIFRAKGGKWIVPCPKIQIVV